MSKRFWVRAEDQLPSEMSKVLVYADGEMFVAVHWRSGTWLNAFEQPLGEMYDGLSGNDITHWRPLPDVPSVESEENHREK
jgi:hypothetical protein